MTIRAITFTTVSSLSESSNKVAEEGYNPSLMNVVQQGKLLVCLHLVFFVRMTGCEVYSVHFYR